MDLAGRIPFNKPFLTGNELNYIQEAVLSGKISGDGIFTRKVYEFIEKKYGFKKILLTTSCTDALEMCAILINIKEGDEVIAPSYTFVSTANAFVLRGAKIVFIDSSSDNPNIDTTHIEPLITSRTKAIVVVHYAGIACNMDEITRIASKYNLFIIEDAAQAIDSYYKNKPLGSIGHFAVFSFHETKNIISGEGGMIVINDKTFNQRAEIIREKGTNRSAYFRGEIDKYGWVDIGSSFLPSEITAAFLFAQLECIDNIQERRIEIWDRYFKNLISLKKRGIIGFPSIPDYATNNGHIFYIICRSLPERSDLIFHLKENGIMAVFHYLALHKSQYYSNLHDGRILENSDRYSECLLRLPLYYELTNEQVDYICKKVLEFYKKDLEEISF